MKLWFFRAVAAAIPLAFAVVLLGGTLWWQGRLVYDASAARLRWQSGLLFVQEPDALLSGHRYLFDPVYGWKNIPNWRAWTHLKPLSINSHGLRGPEIEPAKPPGMSRMLVLGDSFAWGYGVGDDEVFTRRLEARLLASGKRWQVLNSGVSGWGTDQEYLFLTREGFAYGPDVVVLAFFIGNDPANVRESMQYGLHKPVFTNLDLELANQPVPPPSSDAPMIDTKADPLALTLALIDRMGAECHDHDSRLVVMKFGMFLNPGGRDYVVWNRRMREALARHPKLYYLDLDVAFADAELSSETLVGGNANGHWNAIGHEKTAEILHAFLLTHALI